MKIKLFSNTQIIEFNLPTQVFGTFCFDEFDDEESKLINIEAVDDKWYLNSTSSVRVLNNNTYIQNLILEENKFYIIERDTIKYLIHTESIFDNTFTRYKHNNKLNLIVGKNKDCNIYYENEYINGKVFSLKYINNGLVLERLSKLPIYLNKNIIDSTIEKVNIKNGDIIEIFGLRIIVIEGIVLINNPNGSVFINKITANLEDLNVTYNSKLVDGEIKEVSLYKDNEYFSKSPRIRRIISNKTFKIDPPPGITENEEIPLIYTLGPMVTMGMTSAVSLMNVLMKITAGEATAKDSWPQLLIGIAMLSTTLFWPLLTKEYNKRTEKRKRKNNIKKYREYLAEKKKEIAEEAKLQRDILVENLISNEECYNIICGNKLGLWSKRVEQEDFLTARIGMGNYPLDITIDCPEDGFTMEDITLKKEAMEIAKEYEILENVPIRYSFLNRMITAVMGNNLKTHKFIENIILQLVTFYSYEDLKIVVFTNKENENKWEFIKYLPHNFNNSRNVRFFSSNNEDTKELSSYLEQEVNNRRYDENMQEIERDYTTCRPYYLIITDNYSKLRRLNIMKTITELNSNYGFSLVILENKVGRLPSKCNNFISIGDKTSGVLEDAYENQINITFNDEINYNIDMNNVSKRLFNIPIEFESGNKELPNSVAFLEMENVGKVEQLNIINRWKNNDPTKSLKAEIGVDEDGDLMYLDLHEKYHGPHGLIAGMTGSGKSEFIITYVLSMAVNYSPEEVSFILIDYKGGGLAGAFENKNTGVKLPHLAGTITNLDKAEMDRTLVSIDSELRRRQQVFNEARDALGESTIDIYKYQQFYREGKLNNPVPHLIIVCDEFAELKSQQPEFMDNLISTARIGRSLGVHLILATQKPSGVVNDQIWSNSKFRVCLKVQEKSDSQEMLKRPEAAELKQVGRFYLQVGYNEYFALGQSAWCGAKYYPSDKVKKNIDKTVKFINNIGYPIKTIKAASSKKSVAQGEQLANILNHIIEAAKLENVSSDRLWLESIPETIYVNDLIKKYNVTNNNYVEAVIGEYDDPNNQRQDILKVNLNNDGNIIVYSAEGVDRELVLDSIIYSTSIRYSNNDINYYIVDYGSESLRKFNNFPHIGDMVFIGEDEKLNNLIKMIKEIITERKKLFAPYGGEYNNYIKNSKEKLPLIGIIINNYDSFNESCPNVEEELITITRDGLRYGIFFILTANSDSSVRRKIKQNFNTELALRLNDITDYNSLFGRIETTPKDVAGRGIFKTDNVYEFQTAKIVQEEDTNEILKDIGNKLKQGNKYIAKSIPTLPNVVTLDYVDKYLNGITSVPIGISKSSLDVINYDFTSYISTFILSTNSNNTSEFSKSLLFEFSKLKNICTIVVDMNNEIPEVKKVLRNYFNNSPEKVIDILIDYIKKIKETNNGIKSIIYIQNFNKFKMKIENTKLEELTKEIKSSENVNIIISDDYKKLKKYEFDAWYRNIQNDTDGIWIGTGLSDQNLFKLSKISKEMGYTYKNNFGFSIKDGRCELIKTIEIPKEGDNNE